MSWSETAVLIEAEDAQRLDDHDHAGDDRGSAVGMQPAHRAPLRLGQGGEALRGCASQRREGHARGRGPVAG